MNTKSLTLVLLAVLVLGGGVFFFTRNETGQTEAPTSIQSHRSYSIKSDASGKSFMPVTPASYSFSIVDDQGSTVKDFAITHTKTMHVIVVRKDLANFQHVHPEYNEVSGTFTLNNLTFSTVGEYRIFADFAPESAMKDPMGMPLVVTLSEDVRVGNLANYKPQAIGTEEKTKTFDGLRVSLATHNAFKSGEEAMVMFNLSQGGKPTTDLEEYLGALGHAVVLREGTLDFIHAHPMEDSVSDQNGTVSFMVAFPQVGKYKIFIQFQRDGKVTTTDLVVSVAQGVSGAPEIDMSMSGIEH